MPRAKYFNKTTGKWEYADAAYGGGSGSGGGSVVDPDSISTALSQAFNEQDVFDITMELGLIDPVVAYDGSFYTNENGSIYSL